MSYGRTFHYVRTRGMKPIGLRFGPIEHAVHIVVDMQRMFAEDTEWHTPWIERVAPLVEEMVDFCPDRTVFTRFIPALAPVEAAGTWMRYYEQWTQFTLSQINIDLVSLLPALARHCPPAFTFDKGTYSPWHGGSLHHLLRPREISSIIVSGAETDVCVLATVLGAVDYGYRVVIAADAICSSSDQTHDALLSLYGNRFSMQVELASTEEILDAWHR